MSRFLAGLWERLGSSFARPPVHPALTTHRAAQAGREAGARLGDLEFVVLDTELTGFDPKRDAIVSVAAGIVTRVMAIPQVSDLLTRVGIGPTPGSDA